MEDRELISGRSKTTVMTVHALELARGVCMTVFVLIDPLL